MTHTGLGKNDSCNLENITIIYLLIVIIESPFGRIEVDRSPDRERQPSPIDIRTMVRCELGCHMHIQLPYSSNWNAIE